MGSDWWGGALAICVSPDGWPDRVFPFGEDTRLFAARGMTGATGNWYCGLHQLNDTALVLHLLPEGAHFVDVGAYIGSHSSLAAVGGREGSGANSRNLREFEAKSDADWH